MATDTHYILTREIEQNARIYTRERGMIENNNKGKRSVDISMISHVNQGKKRDIEMRERERSRCP